MIDIKFCEHNYENGTENVVKRLKNDIKDGEIEVVTCLGLCGECSTVPFALVNDKLIKADTPEKLYDKIMKKSNEV
ncbi:DUF1450 domain-containing protein [Oceanirhabdus sp. W0125-5]|uniref:DUF1450 domain-containing protein n=1 Tax=Oceanirhabdus sp. W0125-5 TaxID=2999116 RepID=UPI0022F2FC36|nr:DUF1450 domain-containing protein [Oceanirhabdus sp. W0125-5]WBW97014.1 DUF1450 domain-containing protein [Oceanirhabdus sp. W0125-5]